MARRAVRRVRRSSKRSSARRTKGTRRVGRRPLQDNAVVPYGRAAAGALGVMAGRMAYNQGMRIANNAVRRVNDYLRGANRRRADRLAARRNTGPITRFKRMSTGEIGRSRSKVGRYVPVTINRLVSMTVPKRVLRFQRLAAQDQPVSFSQVPVANAANNQITGSTTVAGSNLPGHYAMTLQINGAANTADVFPMYMIDLGATNNVDNTSAIVMYGCGLTTTGDPTFCGMTGLDANSNPVAYWTNEITTAASASPNSRYIAPQWYDVRFALYGANRSQTVYTIDYVQMTAEHFSPRGTAGGNLEQRERVAWYRSLVRSYVTSSIAGREQGVTKTGWKVLKSWQYQIKPHLSIETDDTPNSVVARMFLRDGRLLKYAEAGTTPAPTDAQTSTINFWKVIDTSNDLLTNHPSVGWSQRFLVIRANVTDNTATLSAGQLTGTSVNITPSFDMLIRKKEFLMDDGGI